MIDLQDRPTSRTECEGTPRRVTLRDRVAESAMRVAPELFGSARPAGRIIDAFVDGGDALVVEIDLDPSAGHDHERVAHLVADEVAAAIAPSNLAVWCRVRVTDES
jgi:hypothetical protein